MGPPTTLEERLWDDAYVAWWWLHTFGKSPQEVDEMPAVLVTRIPQVNGLYLEWQAEEQKRSS